jgi:hypothetical protein
MLQCYVLTCGRSVTVFSAPPLSQRQGQGPRSPHPKAGPGWETTVLQRLFRVVQLYSDSHAARYLAVGEGGVRRGAKRSFAQ